jgi:hypothetical protein
VEFAPQLETAKIEQPAFFIAGVKDLVLSYGEGWADQMDSWVTDPRGKVFMEGAGHWVQLARPAAVTEALLGFLKTVVMQNTIRGDRSRTRAWRRSSHQEVASPPDRVAGRVCQRTLPMESRSWPRMSHPS